MDGTHVAWHPEKVLRYSMVKIEKCTFPRALCSAYRSTWQS